MNTAFHVNTTAARIAQGDVALCMSVRLTRSVEIALMARAAGFDALYVDLEHGAVSPAEAGQIFATALAAGITPMARLPSLDPALAASLLGNGALGLIVPHVRSAAALEPLLQACRFPPHGHRSLGGASIHFGYRGSDRAEMAAILARETMLVVMLEDPHAIEQADAIAALPGVSGIMIGSNDFLAELGDPGNYRHPLLLKAFGDVGAACTRHGKFLGVAGIRQDKELVSQMISLGARFVTCGSDSAILAAGLAKAAAALRP